MKKTSLLIVVLLALPAAAMACDDEACPMHLKKDAAGKITPSHDTHAGHALGHSMPTNARTDAATQALDNAMAQMHKAMMVPYTGNPDIDFLRGMVPHHQGAIDMAKIVLKYGKDAQVKRLARDIIRAQELEIKWMNRMAAQLEAKAKGPGADSGWLGE